MKSTWDMVGFRVTWQSNCWIRSDYLNVKAIQGTSLLLPTSKQSKPATYVPQNFTDFFY